MVEYQVTQSQSEEHGDLRHRVGISVDDSRWSTPGAVICDQVAALTDVRMVLERIEPDRYTVFVVLDRDSDETLDRVFGAERAVFAAFPRMPFDLRVMKPNQDWNADDLQATSFCRYRRP